MYCLFPWWRVMRCCNFNLRHFIDISSLHMKYHFEVRLSFESKPSKFWTEKIVLSLNLRFLQNSVRFPYQKKVIFLKADTCYLFHTNGSFQYPLETSVNPRDLLKFSGGIEIKKWRERVNNDSLEDKKCHRSTCSQVFFRISVLKNFATFKGEHQRWESFFKNIAGVQLY